MGSVCPECFNSSCFSTLIKRRQSMQTTVESSSEIIKEEAPQSVQSELQFIHQIHKPMIIQNKLRQWLNLIIQKIQIDEQTEAYYNQRQSHYFLQVLKIIHQELQIHEKVYQIAFDCSLIKQLINITEQSYISNDIAKMILREILSRMQRCRSKKEIFEPNEIIDFSQSFIKLKSDIETFNSGLLKVASYLDKDPITRNKEYSHSYLNLSFDLKNQEAIDVLKIVNTMYDLMPLSFGYFAHYLYLSCLRLQEKGTNIQNISRQIKRCVNFLHSHFSFIKISDKEVEHNRPSAVHAWPQQAIKYNTIDVTQQSNASIRQAYLQQFFCQRVGEVQEFIPLFVSLTQQISRSCKGYGYQCKLRIKDKSQSYAIDELKEQVLGYLLNPIRSDVPIQSPFGDINTITCKEIMNYRSSLIELIGAVDKPIFIKQGMLLATVLFDKSVDVYEASSRIIERVSSEQQVKFVQLQSQMSTKNKGYLTLRFLFNNRYIAQLRLVRVSLPDYSKKDGLKQIERHNFYNMAQQIWRLSFGVNCSLIGRSRILSEKYQQLFLTITSYILNNAKSQKIRQCPSRFTQLSQYVFELLYKCKLSINIYERPYSCINSLSLIKYYKQLQDILDQDLRQDPQVQNRDI